MKISKIVLFITVFVVLQLLFCSCTNSSAYEMTSTNLDMSEKITENDYSYKKQMDKALKHISNPEVLATVNDVKITQVDMDLYSISGKYYDITDIVKINVITEFAEENNLELSSWYMALYDDVESEMLNDKELDDEYCLKNYGVTKKQVIEYAQKRIYQLGMNEAYFDLLMDDISSGNLVKKYPELKEDYEKLKENNSDEDWEKIKNAYYEIIAKDYEIVIC